MAQPLSTDARRVNTATSRQTPRDDHRAGRDRARRISRWPDMNGTPTRNSPNGTSSTSRIRAAAERPPRSPSRACSRSIRETTIPHRKGLETENVLDVLGRAKVSVSWLDNDTGGYGVTDRVSYEFTSRIHADPRFCRDSECLDLTSCWTGSMASGWTRSRSDSVLVLHQLGGGPQPRLLHPLPRGISPFHTGLPRQRFRGLLAGGNTQYL